MVEGHQCHRVAHAHRRLLVGRRFAATSPNGRFASGAAAISGKLLQRIEVHGKNLFYFFGGSGSNGGGSGGSSRQAALLSPVDEDPLQPGAFDADEAAATTPTPAAAAAAAAEAAACPGTPAPKASRRRSSKQAEASAASPSLLASVGATVAAAATAAPAAARAASGGGSGGGSDADDCTDGGVTVVHIHFGMSGAFRTASLPGPEPTPTTRLRLVDRGAQLLAHLSAMTVAHGGLALYEDRVSKLGPDPLRPADDGERFWARMQGSKKPVGLLLMDQSAVAGVGNIYRAEILFKTRLHPEQPGHTVDRATFDVMWGHCVDLLQRGFSSGSILTVDPDDARKLGKPWTRRYIYNQRQCGFCKGPVKVWDMAGRTVYCCEACQPLRLPTAAAGASSSSSKQGRKGAAAAAAPAAPAAAGLLSPARLKSMAAARVAEGFVSHCAPDDPSDMQPHKMTCAALRGVLASLHLDTRGTKAQLVARLAAAQGSSTGAGAGAGARGAASEGGGGQQGEDAGAAQAAAAAPSPATPGQQGAGKRARAQRRRPAAAGAGRSSERDDGGSGRSSGSEDETDRAEGGLAARLSVPAAKRRRRAGTAAAAAAPRAAPIKPGRRAPPPRTGGVASARAAAAEKADAGENRAVEHVALQADAWTDALMFGAADADGGAASDA